MKKILTAIIIATLAVTLLAGCSLLIKKGTDDQPAGENISADTNEDVSTIPQDMEPSDDDLIEATGSFTGMIDNNSVEIITDGEANAYRFDDTLGTVMSEIEMGAKVNFKYKKNEHGQFIITEIHLVEA